MTDSGGGCVVIGNDGGRKTESIWGRNRFQVTIQDRWTKNQLLRMVFRIGVAKEKECWARIRTFQFLE